jgi:hypothetical protein
MNQQLNYAKALLQLNGDRLRQVRQDERGMTTETVIITGIMAAVAVAAGTLIALAITRRAEDTVPTIENGGGGGL